MSQLAKVKYSRNQWKCKAKARGDQDRYLRKQLARVKAERDQAKQALKAAHASLRQLKSQPPAVAVWPPVDVVWLSLRLFVEVHIGLRAVSRVLGLLAQALGIQKAPWAQPLITWVIRLSSVRLQSARLLQGLPLSRVPFRHGLLWMIDSRIGLGTGKMLAVWARAAHHHHLTPGAPALEPARCIGVSVADAWTGDTIAEFLRRLIAQVGRPAAYRNAAGSEWQKAIALLDERGLASPCIDAISHAAAGMRKRSDQQHPAFERFLSACGRVSSKRKHTLLACLAPPTVRTTARLMHVPRLFPWADRVRQRSPAGGTKTGAT
jgi:hypothetical protein